MRTYSWYYNGERQTIQHYVNWPKKLLVKLTPLEWAVRWVGLAPSEGEQPLFNRRLRRAFGRFGIEPVIETLRSMIENPKRFMLPDHIVARDEYMTFRNCGMSIIEALGGFYPRIVEIIYLLEQVAEVAPLNAAESIERIATRHTAFTAGECLRMIFYRYAGESEAIWANLRVDGDSFAAHLLEKITRVEGLYTKPFLEEILIGDFSEHVKNMATLALENIFLRKRERTNTPG